MTEQEIRAYNDLIIQFEKSDLGIWLREKRLEVKKRQFHDLLDAALKSSDPAVRSLAVLLVETDVFGEMETVKAVVQGTPAPEPREFVEEQFPNYNTPF